MEVLNSCLEHDKIPDKKQGKKSNISEGKVFHNFILLKMTESKNFIR